jgi:hypothetical protein
MYRITGTLAYCRLSMTSGPIDLSYRVQELTHPLVFQLVDNGFLKDLGFNTDL